MKILKSLVFALCSFCIPVNNVFAQKYFKDTLLISNGIHIRVESGYALDDVSVINLLATNSSGNVAVIYPAAITLSYLPGQERIASADNSVFMLPGKTAQITLKFFGVPAGTSSPTLSVKKVFFGDALIRSYTPFMLLAKKSVVAEQGPLSVKILETDPARSGAYNVKIGVSYFGSNFLVTDYTQAQFIGNNGTSVNIHKGPVFYDSNREDQKMLLVFPEADVNDPGAIRKLDLNKVFKEYALRPVNIPDAPLRLLSRAEALEKKEGKKEFIEAIE